MTRLEEVAPAGVVVGGKDFQRLIWKTLRERLTPERYLAVWKWNRDLCLSAPDGGHDAEAAQRWKRRIVAEIQGAKRPRARLVREVRARREA